LPRLSDPLHVPSFPTRRSSDLDGGTGPEATFAALSGAVGLGLFAHAEGVEGHSLSSGGGGHGVGDGIGAEGQPADQIGKCPSTPDRKSTRLNSSHGSISYAVFC